MKTIAKDIVICTANPKKIEEFNKILEINKDLELNFQSIKEYIEDFNIEETGETFFENSLLKAQAGAKLTGKLCIADDSGIEINTLNGKPGIYSKRYLESKANGVKDVLEELKGAQDRGCRYVCSIVLVNQDGELVFKTENYWHGVIGTETKGTNGFGFDPIVHPVEYPSKTVAELDSEEKNKLSHRAQAMGELRKFLSKK